jgi:hypothetical protein
MNHENMTAGIREQIGAVTGQQSMTRRTGQAILDGATQRLAQVQELLVGLAPTSITNAEHGLQYKALTLEKARLQSVIQSAKADLGVTAQAS